MIPYVFKKGKAVINKKVSPTPSCDSQKMEVRGVMSSPQAEGTIEFLPTKY